MPRFPLSTILTRPKKGSCVLIMFHLLLRMSFLNTENAEQVNDNAKSSKSSDSDVIDENKFVL